MSFNGFTDDKSTLMVTGPDFWPTVAVADFQARYRLPAEYEAELVKEHLQLAYLWAVEKLTEWQRVQEGSGYAKLTDVPAIEIEEKSKFVLLFERAVFCYAKATSLPQWRTIGRQDPTSREKLQVQDSEQQFFDQAHAAIGKFYGRTRVTCELI